MTPPEFAMLQRVADDVRDLRKDMQDNDREMRQEISDLKQLVMEHQNDPKTRMSGVFRAMGNGGRNGNGNGNGHSNGNGHIKITKQEILLYLMLGGSLIGGGGAFLTTLLGG